MSTLFGRVWRITVGTLTSSDIDLVFKVTKRLAGGPGSAEIAIYNLTDDHRREIRDQRNAPIRLEVGYRDVGPWILFQGDSTRRADITRTGPDWIAKVTGGDGEHALRTTRALRSFGPDARLRDVIQYCADTLGIGIGNVLDQLSDRGLDRVGNTFPEGVVLHGYVYRRLTEALRSAGLSWSIQDGVLQVLQRGQALQRSAVLLSADHGMLDSPEVGKNGIVTVRALLQPDLVPGQLVHIDSRVVTGDFRIERGEYTGDTRGDEWTASLDVRMVGA